MLMISIRKNVVGVQAPASLSTILARVVVSLKDCFTPRTEFGAMSLVF